jgi:hypothetical protein
LWSQLQAVCRLVNSIFAAVVAVTLLQQLIVIPHAQAEQLYLLTEQVCHLPVDLFALQEWAKYASSTCIATGINGNHLFPLQPAAKQQWLTQVTAALAESLGTPRASAAAPAGSKA